MAPGIVVRSISQLLISRGIVNLRLLFSNWKTLQDLKHSWVWFQLWEKWKGIPLCCGRLISLNACCLYRWTTSTTTPGSSARSWPNWTWGPTSSNSSTDSRWPSCPPLEDFISRQVAPFGCFQTLLWLAQHWLCLVHSYQLIVWVVFFVNPSSTNSWLSRLSPRRPLKMVFSFIQVPLSMGLGLLSSTLSCMQHQLNRQLQTN